MSNKNGFLLLALAFLAHSALAGITINGTSQSGAVPLSGSNFTVSGTGTTSDRLIVKESCTITLDNASFPLSTGTTNAISIFPGKTVTLKLSGENTITLSGTKQTGISVPSTSTLNITNITDDAKLIVTATGTRNLAIGGQYCAGKCGTVNIWGGAISASSGTYSAGIGSYNTDGGTVNIYGGIVAAKGGTYGAGIGGGNKGAGGTVNIYGGTVKATGSTDGGGAGIGGGTGGAGGTITIRGGTVTAKSTARGAGIGGGNGGAGGTIKVYGGVVTATGGERGAGIGGGNGGAGGSFYNYGGTVWATAGRADSAYESDIGKGASGSTGSFIVAGGSTIATNGKIDATAKNTDGTRVYRVAVTTPAANTDYTFSGLETYGQTTLRSNSSSLLHLWLPNGSYEFSDEDYIYTATVNGAKTTATRTAKPTTTTVTFKDWDGTIIAEHTDDIGAALTAPANPSREGYTFTGWSPEAPSAFPDKDTTYTAQYTANQYTLTFYDEDGTTVLDTITQDCDSAVTAPTPTKAGYILSGWSPDVPATMPPGNRSFTAKWELAPYFRLVSVTPGTDGKVTVKYDSYNTDLTKGDFTLTVKDANGAVAATVTEWETAPLTEPGEQTAVWDAKDFIAGLSNPADYTFTLSVGTEAEALYMVINLSNGSVEYLPDIPEGGWSDAHKRQYLPLRRIIGDGETGVFQMGSPTTEKGRTSHETPHSVTLTKPYYLGVFPLTTAQYNYVTGGSDITTRYPTTQKTWVDVRGGNNWPVSTAVASDSFMGKLQSLTGNAHFDLPTEAEWEYACRAGSTSALYNGTELASATSKTDSNVAKLAIYSGSGVAKVSQVGQMTPNDLGLYDMLGDVWEWVLDRTQVNKNTGEIFSNYESGYMLDRNNSLDPVGDDGSTTFYRARRGGAWNSPAYECRSAMRTNAVQTASFNDTGFRVACRDFSAKVGSQIDAENTVSATLGKKPRKGFVMKVY